MNQIMNCIEFESCLQDWLDGPHDSPREVELEEHAAVCDECRALWAEFRTLSEAICAWKQTAPRREFTESPIVSRIVVAGLQASAAATLESRSGVGLAAGAAVRTVASPPANSERTLRENAAAVPAARASGISPSRMAMTALVASLLLLIAGVEFAGQFRLSSPLGPHGAPMTYADGSSVAAPEAGEVDSLIVTARAAYWTFAEQAVGAVRDAAVLVPTRSAAPEPATSTAPVNFAFDQLQADASLEWFGRFGRGLRPIGSSVGEAFGFLWGAVATEEAPAG